MTIAVQRIATSSSPSTISTPYVSVQLQIVLLTTATVLPPRLKWVHVRHWQQPDETTVIAPLPRIGPAGLAAALGQLAWPLDGANDVRTKFKIVRIEPHAETVTTEVYYEAAAHVSGRAIQQKATWMCRWSP